MSNYTQLGFVKQTDGENTGTWGDVLNENLIDLLDDAIGGYVEVSVASGNVTLAFADGTADNNGRHATIKFTGSPGTTRTVTFPDAQVNYLIINGSDGSVICTSGSGAATVTIPTGMKDIIYVDGSDEILSMLATPNISGNVTIGVDDTGYDVKFFGATSGAYMLWDESTDDLVLAGAAGIDLAGDIDVDGTANLDNTDIDGTFAVDGTTISLDATTSLNIDNSNTSNGITIGTATSGVPISIGHTTSETTINDNATVTGNLSVGGTFDVTGTIDFSESAITNAGDIQLDSITGDGDTNTSITFSGSDVITIATGGAGRLTIGDGALSPVTNNQIDLGTASLEFKDAFFDGTVTADAFAGPLTGNVTGNASGSAATLTTARTIGGTSFDGSANIAVALASVGTAVTVADESSDTTCFPLFATAATGDLPPKSGSNLTFNSSSGLLTATLLAGDLTGDVTGNADTATLATTITATANNTTAETVYLAFLDGATGTQGIETDTGLTWNPNTNVLTAANVAGTVTTATQNSITTATGLVTTGALDTGSITSGFGTIDTGASAITTTGLISGGSLDIDNVLINGTTIGHTDDTDLLTLADSALTALGTITVGVDDAGHDVKLFGNAAGAYMEWDASADELRIMGASADATTSTGKLLLATSLTDINANDVIGKIDFQAPHEAGGTDAITVAASIQALAQATFSSSVNATDLIFYTGHSEAATEKFRFTSQGEIGVGGANYGTDGQVMTSGGAGAAPAWEDAGGFTVSSITGATALTEQPAATDEIVLSDAGTLKKLDIKHIQSLPAFQGTMSAQQTVSHNTWTKVTIDTEDFDTGSAFDSSTNYRWTPGVAGKYFIYAHVEAVQRLSSYQWEGGHIQIYKNGSGVGPAPFIDLRQGGDDSGTVSVSFVVDLDGDDYVELYGKARALNDESCAFNTGSTGFGGFRVTGQ